MKLLFKILILLTISKHTFSQNLVPNPSFENYYDCVTDYYYISNSINWTGMLTPDYYNSCVVPTWYVNTDVPENISGFQIPFNGNAYGGLIAYYPSNAREYVQSNLVQALQTNVRYCVSFYLALADTSRYAVKKVGAYFSVDTIIPPYVITTTPPDYYTFTYYNPQVESSVLMNDTANWTNVEGVFLAAGNEEYITIGNFRDDSLTDTIAVRGYGAIPMSYYYIDNVSVEKVLNANAGNDTSITTIDSVQIGNNPTENATYLWQPTSGLSDINAANPLARPTSTTTYIVTKTQCSVITTDTVVVTNLSVGIDAHKNERNYKLYPNPNTGKFTIELMDGNDLWEISISDMQGRTFFKENFDNKKIIIEPNVENGVYIIQIVNLATNVSDAGKLIIQK